MKVGDMVYVVDWGKHYSEMRRWNPATEKREYTFPIKTKLPDYCETDFHWKQITVPNLTLKGVPHKRNPTKVVDRIPVYKDYKYKIIEMFPHPDETRDVTLLLLASTHEKLKELKCFAIVELSGVSELTPSQFADTQFSALIEANLGKWDRDKLPERRQGIPKEIISRFYDEDDRVLFGSRYTKGRVEYEYLEGKFSTDGYPIYIGNSVLYDGKGNEDVKDKGLIRPFEFIKNYVEQHKKQQS